jgi:hypothetical protein
LFWLLAGVLMFLSALITLEPGNKGFREQGAMIMRLEQEFDDLRRAGSPIRVAGMQSSRIGGAIICSHIGMIVWLLSAMAVLMLVVSGLGAGKNGFGAGCG